MDTQRSSIREWVALLALPLAAGLATAANGTHAPPGERQGREVVAAVCGACHLQGKDGAPRIGDVAAWAARASLGLRALTEHAVLGIRNMPAHGGSKGVSDFEIQRAIVYMVNSSGGQWVDPAPPARPALRTSEAIVQTHCAKCHEAGRDGAPRIGDRAAWTARLAKGLDVLAASAAHGYGPMPARGGIPDLDREELRHAILYMFNHGLPPPPPAAANVAAADPRHRQLGGMDIYLGVMDAAVLRAQAQSAGGVAAGDFPSGKGYYHLNISVADRSGQPVGDAQVKLLVSDGMTQQSRSMAAVAANDRVSYGSFFKLSSGQSYRATTEIRRRGAAAPVVAHFEFKAP